MVNNCTGNATMNSESLPLVLRRLLNRFEPVFRERIIAILTAKTGNVPPETVRWDDIQEAVHEAIKSMRVSSGIAPLPDGRTCELALAAFDNGDFQYAEEIADELESSCPAACPA